MTQSQKNTIESLRAEGLTYDKIASAINVSLSTVKMYFSRKQNTIPRCDQCHRRLNVTNRKARFSENSIFRDYRIVCQGSLRGKSKSLPRDHGLVK